MPTIYIFILQALHVIDFKRLIPFNKDTKKKKKRKREEFNEQKLCPKFYFFLQYGNVVKNTYYYLVLVGNSVHRSSKLSEYIFS